jgi:16S rRNA (cytosine967-C5)-methyltransferase
MRTVPRKLALTILTEVLANKRTLDDAIEMHCLRNPSIGAPDRAWLTDITSGVVRNLRRLDLAIDAYSLKKKPAGKIRKILQLAVYQLLHQDRVFPATVVSETVDFVRSEEGEMPAKFVNAILRKISDSRADWRDPPDPGAKAPISEKAAWASLPDWWWGRWERAYGYDKAIAIARASLERPETWFRVKKDSDLPSFLEAGPLPGSAKMREDADAGGIAKLPGYQEGKWIIQDLASQRLVDRFVSELRAKNLPLKVLDRCAAPGGKSVAMSWLGVDVVAADQSDSRRKILTETVSRASPGVRIVSENEVATAGPYSAVWIDAPCSGSGILRRHPDVRWLRNESDITALIDIQAKLLREAFSLVTSGGLVFYSVCSLFPEEGKNQLKGVEALGKVVEEFHLGPEDQYSSDGFYGVILQKN